MKFSKDGTVSRFKARLVAKGYSQREGLDYDGIYSLVVKTASLRTILALISKLGWHAHQVENRI